MWRMEKNQPLYFVSIGITLSTCNFSILENSTLLPNNECLNDRFAPYHLMLVLLTFHHVEVDINLFPLVTYRQDSWINKTQSCAIPQAQYAQQPYFLPALAPESFGPRKPPAPLWWGAFPSILCITDAFSDWQPYCPPGTSGHNGLLTEIYL